MSSVAVEARHFLAFHEADQSHHPSHHYHEHSHNQRGPASSYSLPTLPALRPHLLGGAGGVARAGAGRRQRAAKNAQSQSVPYLGKGTGSGSLPRVRQREGMGMGGMGRGMGKRPPCREVAGTWKFLGDDRPRAAPLVPSRPWNEWFAANQEDFKSVALLEEIGLWEGREDGLGWNTPTERVARHCLGVLGAWSKAPEGRFTHLVNLLFKALSACLYSDFDDSAFIEDPEGCVDGLKIPYFDLVERLKVEINDLNDKLRYMLRKEEIRRRHERLTNGVNAMKAKDFRAAAMIMVFGAWKGYVRQLHETVRKMQRRRQRIWFDAWRRRTGESARETLVHEIEELEARVEEFMRNKSTSKGSGVDLDALLKPHSYLTRLLNAQAGQLGGGKNSDGIQNDGGGGSGAQPPPMQSRRRLTRRGSSMRLAVVNGRKTVVVNALALADAAIREVASIATDAEFSSALCGGLGAGARAEGRDRSNCPLSVVELARVSPKELWRGGYYMPRTVESAVCEVQTGPGQWIPASEEVETKTTIRKKKRKTYAPCPLQQVMWFISQIYESKIVADTTDDNQNHTRADLADFVKEHFSFQYGLPRIARSKLGAFLSGVKFHAQKHRRIYWFGRMHGCVRAEVRVQVGVGDGDGDGDDDDKGDLPPQVQLPLTAATDFFLDFLQRISINSDQMKNPKECAVDSTKSLRAASELLVGRFCSATAEEKTEVVDTLRDQVTSSRANATIDFDVVAETLLNAWSKGLLERRRPLVDLFHACDVNGDGVLTISEFGEALKALFPTTLDRHDVMELFGRALRESKRLGKIGGVGRRRMSSVGTAGDGDGEEDENGNREGGGEGEGDGEAEANMSSDAFAFTLLQRGGLMAMSAAELETRVTEFVVPDDIAIMDADMVVRGGRRGGSIEVPIAKDGDDGKSG